MRFVCFVCASALLTGCGYVGDPLPPALNIPVPVADLRAVQRGDKLVLDFTAPALTTDDIGLTTISAAEVRIGESAVSVVAPKPGTAAHMEIPAREWIGKEAPVRVVLTGPKGQRSRESNVITVRIGEPLRVPSDVKAEPHPDGVRVSWTVADPRATKYRVRRDPESEATVDKPEYIDRGVEMGKEYRYTVTATTDTAESVPSSPAPVIPRDNFAPPTPSNVNAVAGVSTIELNWDPSTARDLKTYSVYRNDKVIGQDLDAPSFSDKQVVSGQRYRYTVSAIDQAGNESAKSPAVEIVAP